MLVVSDFTLIRSQHPSDLDDVRQQLAAQFRNKEFRVARNSDPFLRSTAVVVFPIWESHTHYGDKNQSERPSCLKLALLWSVSGSLSLVPRNSQNPRQTLLYRHWIPTE